ncbi:MAG: glycosyltransferase [Phycisphaeraceae bacterium]
MVIGRNEGVRLQQCLHSALRIAATVVYVDSGSTDGSVVLAKSLGAFVVALDMNRPFTAARARNEGFARLMLADPRLELVQFVDGDVEIVDGWIDAARAALAADPKAAVISGRRRERHPQASVYNRLCDIEWNKPAGYQACEGDALMRVDAFTAMGGFNATLIAGEEPELCLRLRQAGWRVLRTGDEMTLHDVNILRFGQWWRREQRAGHAYAEGAAMHGRAHYLRQSVGIAFWSAGLPLATVLLAWPTRGLSVLVALLLVSLLCLRSWRGARPRSDKASHALLCAIFWPLGKFPMALGQAQYWLGRLTGRRQKLIEYKQVAKPLAA